MWNSLKGYVIIQLDGPGIERFINRMLKNGIIVWDVRRHGYARMQLSIRAKDFFKLRAIKRGARIRISIIEKAGMPFYIARLKHRKVLVFGLIAGLLLLLFAETRCWFVTIDGLETIDEQKIALVLEQEGISRGMALKSISPTELSDALRSADGRIAWAGININGVELNIKIIEAVLIPEPLNKTTPANVVATKNGIIEKISATSGRARVKIGDAVRRGDVLISGDITREGASKRLYVFAEGTVLAKVYYTYEYSEPTTQRIMEREGEGTPYSALYVGGYKVSGTDVPFGDYEVALERGATALGLVLPVKLIRGRVYELKPKEIRVEREDMLAQAQFHAELNVLQAVPKSVEIIENKTEVHWNSDGSVTVTAMVTTLEEIGASVPLNAYEVEIAG